MLNKEQLDMITDATLKKTVGIGLKHAEENAGYIKTTIRDIKRSLKNDSRPALVISAGPSLHRMKSIETIKNSGFKGHVVAVDGAMGHCLRNGIVPEYVLTVDPDPHRIIRWFGDPRLHERPEDDYFQRQDLDPALNKDEIDRNEELLELVDRHGPEMKLIISTSTSPEIARRCIDAGMELYWWNPLYDDYDDPESYTRKVYKQNKVPCMVTGGNCGTSAWVFSQAILRSPEVVMVGMDFSYPPETNVLNTQYYEILKEMMPDNPEAGLIKVYNPHLDETWQTDPAYYWYNQNFLQMVQKAPGKTYNCTEGGILFGDGIEFKNLSETLSLVGQE